MSYWALFIREKHLTERTAMSYWALFIREKHGGTIFVFLKNE